MRKSIKESFVHQTEEQTEASTKEEVKMVSEYYLKYKTARQNEKGEFVDEFTLSDLILPIEKLKETACLHTFNKKTGEGVFFFDEPFEHFDSMFGGTRFQFISVEINCVKTLGYCIFSDMYLLEKVVIGPVLEESYGQPFAFFSKECVIKEIVYLDGCKTTFDLVYHNKTLNGREDFIVDSVKSVSLPDSIVKIGYNSFRNFTNITNLVLPKNTAIIEKKAFAGCGIQDIIINENLKNIDDYAFQESKLRSIDLSDNVISIGRYAFFKCYFLKHVRLPKRLKNIDAGLFFDCRSLVSINIPQSVINIDNYVFSGCSNLRKIVLPKHYYSLFILKNTPLEYAYQQGFSQGKIVVDEDGELDLEKTVCLDKRIETYVPKSKANLRESFVHQTDETSEDELKKENAINLHWKNFSDGISNHIEINDYSFFSDLEERLWNCADDESLEDDYHWTGTGMDLINDEEGNKFQRGDGDDFYSIEFEVYTDKLPNGDYRFDFVNHPIRIGVNLNGLEEIVPMTEYTDIKIGILNTLMKFYDGNILEKFPEDFEFGE